MLNHRVCISHLFYGGKTVPVRDHLVGSAPSDLEGGKVVVFGRWIERDL